MRSLVSYWVILSMITTGLLAQTPMPTYPFSIGPEVPHDPTFLTFGYGDQKEVNWGFFAWQQFLALTWKATYNPNGSPSNTERGVPDTSWQHGLEIPPYLVWETYAHRTELRPNTRLTRPFNSVPQYSYQNMPQSGEQGASFTLLNNLDEDNEIGSCDVYLGGSSDLVLYQAKVNRTMYDYIKEKYPDQNDPNSALARDAAQNIQDIRSLRFPGIYNTPPLKDHIGLPKGSNSSGGSEGVIEIKTAFVRLSLIPPNLRDQFFTRQAIYYEVPSGQSNGPRVYKNDTFALIAMHIIHRTAGVPTFIFTSFEHRLLPQLDFRYKLLTPPPPNYRNFNPNGVQPPGGAPDDTEYGPATSVVRQSGTTPHSNGQLYPISSILETVNAHIGQQLSNMGSIWRYYKLIGVQADLTSRYSPTPHSVLSIHDTTGPNHFMANHVVESDPFLANFIGQGFGNNYLGDGSNVVELIHFFGYSSPQKVNMGGCKGCHGVAQTSFGTEFSFLLDFGNGKPAIDPDPIHHINPQH